MFVWGQRSLDQENEKMMEVRGASCVAGLKDRADALEAEG